MITSGTGKFRADSAFGTATYWITPVEIGVVVAPDITSQDRSGVFAQESSFLTRMSAFKRSLGKYRGSGRLVLEDLVNTGIDLHRA